MHESPTSLDRFIRRVYRRLVVLRLLEWAGLGFAVGCITSLISLLVLRNRTDSPFTVAAAQVLLGTAIGLIAALLRRPQIIDAAVEADRQLDLADLLATAWQIKRSPQHETFEDAVLLIANDRAAHLHPRSVVLHRLGLRAWSGIGLAGALVLTLAILTANPLDTQAASSPFAPQIASNKSSQNPKVSGNTQLSSARPTTISPDHPGGEDDPLPGAGKTTDTTTNATRGQNSDVQSSNPNGAGTGAGKSPAAPDKNNSLATGTNSSRTNTNGTTSSGVGNSTDNPTPTPGSNNTSTSAGNTNKSPTAPAWQSDTWPAARQAADTAITNGQVPPAYHELIREYFKR